ncbi:Dephospho-CoA kinase [Syntrophobotulus glycolicus DSM 8271]|uniref:Dephospho-CoA kinase n=1 Tax=Syntrophobotulus glycolicus (strain DSM 8271 / FlGlyR) TaxID=645991 RepID=F0T2Q4_SYNGF|nr:dephospho-CoA kinase [Syntrophobotulus glycolicus]ADY56453.1 Dephospho-CoA kinase [Syntrophobotulus glycolicus DSM 8271]
MLKIGLTGGIGTGKSSVAQWFAGKGVPVFDADRAVHEILLSKEFTQKIAGEFGGQYIENHTVDRRALADLVFKNKEDRIRLERLIHPLVLKNMLQFCLDSERKGHKIAVLDVPLLFEAGWEKYADEVWVVYIPQELQLERIVSRDKVPVEEAERRIKAQIPIGEKIKKAARIIENIEDWKKTEQNLEIFWKEYLSN